MVKTKRAVAVAIIGLIVIAVTFIGFFLMVSERSTIHWVSFFFIVLSELIAAGGFIAVDDYAQRSFGTMLRAGAFSLLLLYFIATDVVSIVFLLGSGGSVKLLVTIQLVILALAAVIMITIFVSSKSIFERNRLVLQSAKMLKQLENSVMQLKNDGKNRKYYNQLEKIYEAVRFCDNSISVPLDDLIAGKINELEKALGEYPENMDEKIFTLLDEILLLSKKRAAEAAAFKKGGI